MKLFPSHNERLITASLISFMLGLGLGLLAVLHDGDQEILVKILAGSVATLIGAFLAFNIERKQRREKNRELYLCAANSLLYALFEREKFVGIIYSKSIRKHRDSSLREVKIVPPANLPPPKTEISLSELPFLFSAEHAGIIEDIFQLDLTFNLAVSTLKERSELFENKIRPVLDDGRFYDKSVRDSEIVAAIGEIVFPRIKQATDALVKNFEDYLIESDRTYKKLEETFSRLFSRDEIVSFKARTADGNGEIKPVSR